MEGLRVCLYRGAGAGSSSSTSLLQVSLKRYGANVDVYHPKAGQPGLPRHLSERYDVIVFGEGTASVIQKRLAEDDSIDRLKEFIRHGGGYLGFCAGAYLASQSPAEGGVGLGLLEARYTLVGQQRSKSSHGKAHKPISVRASVEMDASGTLLEGGYDVLLCGFNNGTLWDLDDLGPTVETLATVSGVCNSAPVKGGDKTTSADAAAGNDEVPCALVDIMMGKAGIIAGLFGLGRVVVAGPQVEQAPDLEDLLAFLVDLCTSPCSSLSISSSASTSLSSSYSSSCLSSPIQNENDDVNSHVTSNCNLSTTSSSSIEEMLSLSPIKTGRPCSKRESKINMKPSKATAAGGGGKNEKSIGNGGGGGASNRRRHHQKRHSQQRTSIE